MFGKLFGKKPKPEARAADSIEGLRPGDMIRLGFDAREALSNREYEVTGLHTIDLGTRHGGVRRVLHLGRDRERPLFVWRDHRSGDLAFAYLAPRVEVEASLDLDQFGTLFDDDRAPLTLDAVSGAATPWLAARYHEESAQEAYRRDQDVDANENAGTLGAGDLAFDFYQLVSADRSHAIEVEVYDGGRTDVLFIAYLGDRKIEDYYVRA